jgi:hypothetical protein
VEASPFQKFRVKVIRNLSNCVPRIINKIMSYTCVSGIKIEHQETGYKTNQGLDTFVFNRMIVLASKHYVARDASGKLYSKGVSYVRRTGSMVQNVATKRFANAILSTSSRSRAVSLLRKEYTSLRTSVLNGKYTELYRVRATKNAITKDYIKVLPHGSRKSAAQYAEFKDLEKTDVDIDYYLRIIESCLTSMCRCIGLPDRTLYCCDQRVSRPHLILL